MDKKTWIIILVVAASIAGLAVFMFNSSDSEEPSTTQQTEETVTEEDQTSTPEDDPAATQETELVAVGNYSGSGIATRTVEGEFVHEVTAILGPPAEGDFYEGWLVGPSVVSTGKLVSEGGGEWSLVFTSDQDLSEHNDVVITEETEADGLDGIPEDHVLEGSF